ncbi:MAG: hypothetical protein JW940_08635, partial [Polyangiaceae bacterium]|nr:hypothetical protein [Polyangiaceae bacterium]
MPTRPDPSRTAVRPVLWCSASLLAAAVLLLSARAGAQSDATPFSAVDVGRDTLVFARPRGTSAEYEGFVVDTRALISTLKTRVLEASGLGEVAEVTETGEVRTLRSSAKGQGVTERP